MFAQYQEFDVRSEDSTRLANRGGALLQEEKERKRLEKAIPKMEEKLRQISSSFDSCKSETCEGVKQFLVYGMTVDDMITSDWDTFYKEKERRKEAKVKKYNLLSWF